MKKAILILSVLFITRLSVSAQSAVALFKPLYGGDEHYAFATASSLDDAKEKALSEVKSVVDQKVGSRATGQQFIYTYSNRKGFYAIGRGKDQYGHYWHFEAALGYSSESAAKRYVLDRLAARGLYDTEIYASGED
ncbi:hypothetical protein BDD43_2360 [Mucilaginibacter gracilis]|uniref:Uncharacterized protein n=1 Tax=Mucilaginibacter gracilis TaxID=423350 RepID=A0A495J2E9_9SPHI|nr:hypothetical protein [Mucilaginibacter gracilis]RKR82189.1 hypothetical protein BDD43_2360 [Mucilaginibacter gracilis]